jgi:hypothetical protein
MYNLDIWIDWEWIAGKKKHVQYTKAIFYSERREKITKDINEQGCKKLSTSMTSWKFHIYVNKTLLSYCKPINKDERFSLYMYCDNTKHTPER